jgi:hypothetical protein
MDGILFFFLHGHRQDFDQRERESVCVCVNNAKVSKGLLEEMVVKTNNKVRKRQKTQTLLFRK